MPGLTSAVERKREGKKLWRSEGYFWLNMSTFLLGDLERGFLAAFTLCSKLVAGGNAADCVPVRLKGSL